MLTHANRLESLGKRLGRGEDGGLCIGYIENAMYSGVLSTALRTLRVSRPNVHIALYSQPPATQIEGLRQRSLDFLSGRHAAHRQRADLDYIQVLDDRMLLALPQNHPLAQEENLVASQLGDEQWIAVIHNDDAHSRDHFVAACVNAGFNPDIRLEAGNPHGIRFGRCGIRSGLNST